MPPRIESNNPAGYEIDKSRHSVVVRRHIPTSTAQVYAYWTEPKHLREWWDPSGVPLIGCDIDLRVGGTLRFINAREPNRPFVGKYIEIDPPYRIVFEAMGAVGTVLISESGGGSDVKIEIRAPTADGLKAMLGMGVATGTVQTIENLEAYSKRM